MPEFTPPPVDLAVIALPTIIIGWAMALLMLDLFLSRPRTIGILALLGVIATAIAGVFLWDVDRTGFNDMVVQDRYSLYINWILLAATALTILISLNYLPRVGLERGEYYPLLLFATGGMLLLAQANDLIIFFLAIELLSITLYILTGFSYPRLSSGEAAMKYLLLGAFAAGFLVYGIALVYGITGQTALPAIATAISTGALDGPTSILLAGMGLLIIALGFKVAVVPFHTWTPDVYEGAPTPVTAYMSVATKAAAFAALFRLLVSAFPDLANEWQPVLAVLAVLTMIVGNVVAIMQSNLKRMLAYSSIAHAGYIMLAIIASGSQGATALLIYLLAYALTNIGAFAVALSLELRGEERGELTRLNGLASHQPLLAAAMALFMISLAGVPPTAGFVAKFAVFQAAWQSGFAWLAVVGVITSVISAFFYLRVIVLMYMGEPVAEERAIMPAPLVAGLAVAAVLTLLVGVLPSPLLDIAQRSLLAMR